MSFGKSYELQKDSYSHMATNKCFHFRKKIRLSLLKFSFYSNAHANIYDHTKG